MSILKKAKRFLFPAKKSFRPEHDYVSDVVNATGWSYSEAKKNMDIVKDQLGIPYDIYFEKEYYSFTRSKQERAAESWLRKKAQSDKILKRISKATGFTKEYISSEIEALNASVDTGIDIDLKTYNRYGLYEMTREEAVKIINLLAELDKRAGVLRSEFKKVDKGELTYDAIQDQIDEYYELTGQSITPHLKKVLLKNFKNIITELKADDKKALDLITDVEVSHSLLDFPQSEYKTFHLYLSSLPEKRLYVSDLDRRRIPSKFNSEETFDLLSNKFFLYKKMPDLFGRDMTAIYSEDDYDSFAEFADRHPVFVCKPFSSSIGRGVSLISIEDPSNEQKLRELFDTLLKENRIFLMEERILPDKSMSSFNRDSLNTVRVIAFYKDGSLTPVGAFFRSGRAGSFVDNGGAGGIFAAIDCKTGKIITDGTDEQGAVYTEHPDSHIVYKDFQIPEWDQALSLAKEACKALADTCYVGWDLAFTSDNKWVIVEGNGRSTYLHQGPLFHGIRPEVMELVSK